MPEFIIRTHSDQKRVMETLGQLAMTKPWRVSLTPYKSRRSSEQNNRAWALYRAIADETGYTAGEVHAICKAKFGEPRVIKMGDVEVTEWTTRDRDVMWFGNYLERCEQWASEQFGILLG